MDRFNKFNAWALGENLPSITCAAGYETNYNRNIQSEGFSLAGKKYQKAFHDTAMRFRREQGLLGPKE
jgi:hypothetical protein